MQTYRINAVTKVLQKFLEGFHRAWHIQYLLFLQERYGPFILQNFVDHHHHLELLYLPPVDLHLISKKSFEKSSLTNLIFSLFRTGFLLPVLPAKINFKTDYCRLKIQVVKLDFSNLILQNSSTDQQGVRSRDVAG